MRSIHWKLGLFVSALHGILLIILVHVSWHPIDHTAQSVVSGQVIELRSNAPANRVTTRFLAKPASSESMGVLHDPTAHRDESTKLTQAKDAHPTSAAIAPPSADGLGLNNPKPPYPISSKENGEQGAVMLYACITDHGKVERLDLAQSSGHPALDRSALNTVRHWSFRPAQESGKSIPMCYRLPIRFLLSSYKLQAVFA